MARSLNFHGSVKRGLTFLLVVLIAIPVPVLSGEPLGGLGKGVAKLLRRSDAAIERDRPHAGQNLTVNHVAGQIDWLEHHIDKYGSIVPKQPDVWGEARLTKHRQEIEVELRNRLCAFDKTLQASLRRKDLADLSFAIAIGLAADGQSQAPAAVVTDKHTVFEKETTTRTESKETKVKETATVAAAALKSPTDCPTAAANTSLSLEPTLFNEQLYGYLEALNQLRRINEGDDNSDSPGYALNLVRLPVSVLPGKHTRAGYGAEVTFTAEPVLGPDLLPATFRQLVINDIVDQLALPLTHLLANDPQAALRKIQFVARGDYEADQIMAKVDRRLATLANLPGGEYEKISVFFNQYFSYLRNRFAEIAVLDLTASDARQRCVADASKADLIEVDSRSFEFMGAQCKFRAYTSCRKLLRTMNELLDYGFTINVVDCELAIGNAAPVRFPLPLICIESTPDEWIPGNLPYEIGLYLPDLVMSSNEWSAKNRGINQRFRDAIKPNGAVVPNPEMNTEAHLAFKNQLERRIQEVMSSKELRGLIMQKQPQTDSKREESHTDSKEAVAKDDLTFGKAIVEALGRIGAVPLNDQEIKNLHSDFMDITYSSIGLNGVDKTFLARLQSEDYRDFFSYFSETSTVAEQTYSQTGAAFPSPSRQRRAMQPLSPTQLVEVLGHDLLLRLTQQIVRNVHQLPPNEGTFIHLIDVRRFLFEELQSAYDFMSQQERQLVWAHAGSHLAQAVSSRQNELVRAMRNNYFDSISDTESGKGLYTNVATALSWAILVESSLLNEHLISEMNQLAGDKGCNCSAYHCPCFFGPNPPVEARDAFARYVSCRWPIQVFALDPETQDQNVEDSFEMQRNLQLAAAVAVASGRANINTATNFVRTLQTNIDTLSINRTAVAFAHGNNTFGWRFYPRVQTPETPGTLGAFGQTLLGGPSKTDLMKQRQLEPGMRECTAIVVMPTFVPYLNIHSRASWFHVNNPANRELTMKETMELSAACEAVQRAIHCVPDSNCYRPGDVAGLSVALAQLGERLPIQQKTIPVPYENSLGGFEMLGGGSSDLSVELQGWYGAPGINPEKPTNLFLVGKGFSVHQTEVLVGGHSVEHVLLSREIMKVTVPEGVNAIGQGKYSSMVDVHVATPYGVSSHLMIPLTPEKPKPTLAAAPTSAMWKSESISIAGTVEQRGQRFECVDLTFGAGGKLELNISPPPSATERPNKLGAELLMSTPAGLGWAPEFKKVLDLEIQVDDSGNATLSGGQLMLIQKSILDAINKGLFFQNDRRNWTLFLRGTLIYDKNVKLAVDRDVRLDVLLTNRGPESVQATSQGKEEKTPSADENLPPGKGQKENSSTPNATQSMTPRLPSTRTTLRSENSFDNRGSSVQQVNYTEPPQGLRIQFMPSGK